MLLQSIFARNAPSATEKWVQGESSRRVPPVLKRNIDIMIRQKDLEKIRLEIDGIKRSLNTDEKVR